MRKATILVLVALLAIALVPTLAYAAGYDEPTAGESPHAGWTTTSDQCKQCHAVHMATGNRLLLRSMDSRYNDCAYCHLDGTGGAGFDVYIGDLDNGHTLGSYVSKEATGGARPSRWDSQGRVLVPDNSQGTGARTYRGGSPAVAGTSDAYTGLDTVAPVTAGVGTGLRTTGDTTFNCNACHMAHANPSKVITWRFQSFNEAARTRDTSGLYTYYGPDAFSYKNTNGSTWLGDSRIVNTSDLTSKILVRDPNNRTDAVGTYYAYNEAEARASNSRNSALTMWCADCHNLNVKGPGMVNGQVTEYATAYTEQAGFYSHSTYYNLSGNKRAVGISPADLLSKATHDYPATAGAPSCADCHVGYSDATVAHDAAGGDATLHVAENYGDWPHSGSSSSYALLNELMTRSAAGDALPSTTGITNEGTDASTYDAVGLDGQCRQCHGPDGRDPADIHNDNTETGTTFAPNAEPF